MPRFRVNIAPGVSQIVDAATEDDARKIIKSEIAKGTVSPFFDELFFDYETGVNNKELRRKLGRAETMAEEDKVLNDILTRLSKTKSPLEQEDVIDGEVGSSGYIRNTKGQLALTPEGLEILGLPIQQRKLQDGTIVNLNTIIDENSFNLKTGDLADFSGIAGPVIGTIVSLLPQARIVRGLAALLGGRQPMARMLAAGTGSAAGKAGEEYLDAQEGFQLQDSEEIKKLIGYEFGIGSIGQGLFGEVPAKLYNLLLGKRAPIDNQRLMNVMSKNLSYKDVVKLDNDLGRAATPKEIARAVRDGRVKKFDWKYSRGAIPAQASLEKMLPGRYQQISEQVLGNNRDIANKNALFAELDYILNGIKSERAALDSYISQSSKGRLDESVNQALQKLRNQEKDVTESLKKMLKDIGSDVIEIGNYGQVPSRREFGETLKDVLFRSRSAVMRESGERYGKVDQKFLDIADPRNKEEIVRTVGGREAVTGPAQEARIINKTINNIVNKYVLQAQRLVKDYKNGSNTWNLQAPGTDIKTSVVAQLDAILENMRKRSQAVLDNATDESGELIAGINLQQIRNDVSRLKDFHTEVVGRTPEGRLLSDVVKVFDNYKPGQQNADSMLTELVDTGKAQIKADLKKAGIDVNPILSNRIRMAIDDLRTANKLHYERMRPFDKVKMDRLISNAQKGSISADDVYKRAILSGEPGEFLDIVNALRGYDEYLARTKQATFKNGKQVLKEVELKSQIKRRLFNDAFRVATKDDLTSVNFTDFARQMKKFDMENQGKFDELFRDPVTQRSSGKDVLRAIDQLNMIGPRIKPQDLKSLVNDFTKDFKGKGLDAYASGRKFINELENLAKASDERLKFEANRAISRLPEVGIEETVNSIFRPGSAANIIKLKNTVDDEVFNSIQQASMQKLLAKSIDFNGKGKVTDVFKHQNLKTALDSYGDETLEAMFGRELAKDLRTFQKEIDILTLGEVGRGAGGAGGLVAAGIAATVIFTPLATLPIVAGLAVARSLFGNRAFVRLMTKTDPGSITQAFKIFNNTLRQFGLRYVDGQIQPFAASVADVIETGVQDAATEAGVTGGDVEGITDEGLNIFQQLREQVTAPLKTSELQLPDVQPMQSPTDPLSPERIDFAEQVAGRPIV